MLKVEKGGHSKDGKPTCAKCGQKYYCKCLLGSGSCVGCGKDGHKGRYYPIIDSKGREGKQFAPSVPKDDAPTKRRFYALQYREEKADESNDDICKFSLSNVI